MCRRSSLRLLLGLVEMRWISVDFAGPNITEIKSGRPLSALSLFSWFFALRWCGRFRPKSARSAYHRSWVDGIIDGKWLLDGEYITKDKFNEPIRLYMIFDVYWCDIKGIGIPKEAHTLPFIARDPDDNRSRKYILDKFMETVEMKGKTNLPKWAPVKSRECPTEIRLKTYEFGYQSESTEEKINPIKNE